MGFSSKTAYYRDEIRKCVECSDTKGALLNIIAYSKTLREMADAVKLIKDKAFINHTADCIDVIAAMVKKDGISGKVKHALLEYDLIDAASVDLRAPAGAKPKTKSASAKSKAKSLAAIGGVGVTTLPPVKADLPTRPMPALSDTELPKHKLDLPSPQDKSTTDGVNNGNEWSADMFEKYASATLEIRTRNSAATGFLISPNGYFLTNHHVAYDDGNRKRSSFDVVSGDEKIISPAELIAADEHRDVALMRVKSFSGKTPFIPLIENYDDVRVGTDMMIIGNGLSFGLAPITGTVKFTAMHDGELVYTAPTNGGDSGSPVINRSGKCIGIHKARADESTERQARGIAYATPAVFIKELLDKWVTKYNIEL